MKAVSKNSLFILQFSFFLNKLIRDEAYIWVCLELHVMTCDIRINHK